jgi:predicted NUDIX family NTP pyrophosphohydrolase
MPQKVSAGILLYRRREAGVEVLLVHPGGPFWAKKDDGAWSIPKGEYAAGDDPLSAAKREFEEETGAAMDAVSRGDFLPLTPIKQAGGKIVTAWSVEGDFDPTLLRSNVFELEWPPKSGRKKEFPEVDRAAWFSPDDARRKLLASQAPLLDELLARTSSG